MTYCFYDLETTGTNHCFDQIVQFASIQTDENFVETSRRSFFVQVRNDVNPAPGAVLTTKISPLRYREGICEFDALREMHTLMNRPGMISAGYNSISFDDQFLTFGFYRNLLPPYTHRWANGCRRFDLYHMAALFAVYRPEVLNWPVRDGRIRLKLELLNEANGLAEGQAHDAETDVEVLIALTRRLAGHQDAFEYGRGFFDKREDERRCKKLPAAEVGGWARVEGTLIEPRLGGARNFQAPVLNIGEDAFGRQVWLELDALPETLEDESERGKLLHRKKFGEPPFLLPPNRAKIGEERLKLATEAKRFLQSRPDLVDSLLRQASSHDFPQVANLDPDAALYQHGFLSREEESACRRFHETDPATWGKLIDAAPSERIKVLAARVLRRNFPSLHPNLAWPATQDPGEERVFDYRGQPKRTAQDVLDEVAALRSAGEMPQEDVRLLDALANHLSARSRPQATPAPRQESFW